MADSELTEASKYRSIQSLFAVPDVSTILREAHRLRRWWRKGSYRVVKHSCRSNSDPHISRLRGSAIQSLTNGSVRIETTPCKTELNVQSSNLVLLINFLVQGTRNFPARRTTRTAILRNMT